MVKMGTVWDRTVEVLNGRTGMIAPIALLGMLLPSVVRDGFAAYSTPGTMQFALVGIVLAIGTLAAMLWAQLAIVGIATDPATDAASARRQASARAARGRRPRRHATKVRAQAVRDGGTRGERPRR